MRCQLDGRACDEEPKAKDRLTKETEMLMKGTWLLLYSSRKKRQTLIGQGKIWREKIIWFS